jgi:hypothetical protein
MGQIVSRRPYTTEDRVRLIHVGFVVDKLTLGQVFLPSSSVFPCQYHSTVALQTHII